MFLDAWFHIVPIPDEKPGSFMSDRPTILIKSSQYNVIDIGRMVSLHYSCQYFFLSLLFTLFFILFTYHFLWNGTKFKFTKREWVYLWPYYGHIAYYVKVVPPYFYKILFIYTANDVSFVYNVPIIKVLSFSAIFIMWFLYIFNFYLIRFSKLHFLIKIPLLFINSQLAGFTFIWHSYVREFLIRNPREEHDAIGFNSERYFTYWFRRSDVSNVILEQEDAFTYWMLHKYIFSLFVF
jgi:hypothetical protein